MRPAYTSVVVVGLCVIQEATGAPPLPNARTLTASSLDGFSAPLGFLHIPKTGGSTIETAANMVCSTQWGNENPGLPERFLRIDAPLSGATDFCVSSPFDLGWWGSLGIMLQYGVIFAEHVPPIFWVNQYKHDLYEFYGGGVFTAVRNPITRAVSSWKHFSGLMFNGTQQDVLQSYAKTSPSAAALTWPESEACDPQHMNEWLARYLTDAAPRIARIEAVQELPAGKPCSEEFEDLHANGARSTTLDSGFQNTIPQWLYVKPPPSTNAPQGYPVPVERIIALEDFAAGYTTMMNSTRVVDLFDSGRASPMWQCLAALDLDDPAYEVSDVWPFGEPDCSTGDLTAALNETVLGMIRTFYARDFEVLGYPTELSRVYELPQILNLSSPLRQAY